MQSTGRSSYHSFIFIRHLTTALIVAWMSVGLMAAVIHVEGTYDLDQDGQSELLLLTNQDGLGAVRYVEMDSTGQHQVLWSFSPQEGRSWRITDAKLLDLNGDFIPELVATVLAINYDENAHLPWLYVFSWEGTTFSKDPLTLTGFNGSEDQFRPVNITHYLDPVDQKPVLVIALGSPSRQVVLFKPLLTDNSIDVVDPVVLKPDLSKNGYARLFAGVFQSPGGPYLAAFSPEGNLLKTTLYTLRSEIQEVVSDVLALQGSRNLIGPAIAARAEEVTGVETLLLPFEDGTVLTLSYADSILTLVPSPFSNRGLFVLPLDASDSEINTTVLARVEQGLYGSPLTVPEVSIQETSTTLPPPTISPVITIQDSVILGDTLVYQATPDTAHGFYSFRWLKHPPTGARFQPLTGIIQWAPTREQLGSQMFAFTYAIRLGEKLVSDQDSLGDRHHLTPVLEQKEAQFTILVVDSALPILPPVEVPVELYQVVVTVPAKAKGEERFIFDGEVPFGVQVDETRLPVPTRRGAYFTHTITANLGSVTESKQVLFSYQKNEPKGDLFTLTITHDFTGQVLRLSVTPSTDSVAQSYNPEDWLAYLYRYPEYFFEGFPHGMSMDTVGRTIHFSFGTPGERLPRRYSTIQLFSPTKPEHVLTLRIRDIDLRGVRGAVQVTEDSSRIITTAIDFTGSFVPFDMTTDMSFLESVEQPDEAPAGLQGVKETSASLPSAVPTDTTGGANQSPIVGKSDIPETQVVDTIPTFTTDPNIPAAVLDSTVVLPDTTTQPGEEPTTP